jgi:hypothetical protein
MKPGLALSFGYDDGSLRTLAGATTEPQILLRDIYSLPEIDLNDFSVLFVSMHSDQRFLATRASQIEEYLVRGGVAVANGHYAYSYLPRMAGFHTIDNYKLGDITVLRLAEHPIWHGIDPHDLTFRRGVSGFYGRVWHEAPPDAQVIHALGKPNLPLDFIYPVGRGRVLFHGGNDLWSFGGEDKQLAPRIMQWVAAGRDVQ